MPGGITVTRSRNGCAVCKSKRLKCDEARPRCSRCERLGIACPGYQKPVKWADTSRPARNWQPTSSTRAPQRATSQSSNTHQLTSAPTDMVQPAPVTMSPDQPMFLSPVSPDLYDMGLFDQATALMASDHNANLSNLNQAFSSPSTMLDATVDVFQYQTASPRKSANDSPEMWLDTLLQGQGTGTTSLSEISTSRVTHTELTHQNQQTTITPHLQDRTSILVEYYFKEVCAMMSCYDSTMNPYRTTVSKVWTSSPSLYYVTQSMAAACLSEVSPALASAGRQLRDQATASLSMEVSTCSANGQTLSTPSMLALVMLGFSLSWHDVGNVGLSEFNMLSQLIVNPEAHEVDSDALPLVDQQRNVFFYNSLVYWRMLLSFVTDQELPQRAKAAPGPQPRSSHSFSTSRPVVDHTSQGRDNSEQNSRLPHPQTGVGIRVMELIAEVGALVRRERQRIRSRRHASRADMIATDAAIQAATELHSQLRNLDLPREASVLDLGDDATPAKHLLKVADAYRCAGLLLLYRNFPDLASVPSTAYTEPTPTSDFSDESWMHHNTSPDQGGLALSSSNIPSTGEHETTHSTQPSYTTITTCLALHIVGLLRDIPTSSRSSSIQPLLHVMICSELSLSRQYESVTPSALPEAVREIGVPCDAPSVADILTARRSVLARLAAFEHVLAAKPIRLMIGLVKQTWKLMDDKREEVFWMDVMINEGMVTLMG